MDNKYIVESATPMRYHKYFNYVALPITIIGCLLSMFNGFIEFNFLTPFFQGVVLFDAAWGIFITIMSFRSIVGLYKRSLHGYKATILLLTLSGIYGLYSVVLGIIFRNSQLIVTGIVYIIRDGILTRIYYTKRKRLFSDNKATFSPLAENSNTETKEPLNTTPVVANTTMLPNTNIPPQPTMVKIHRNNNN